MQQEAIGTPAADSQKAKLLMMFCALGFAVFLLDLAAGAWLWKYTGDYRARPPAYDRILADVRSADPQGLADIALAMHAGWEAAEEARSGVQETVVHITIAAELRRPRPVHPVLAACGPVAPGTGAQTRRPSRTLASRQCGQHLEMKIFHHGGHGERQMLQLGIENRRRLPVDGSRVKVSSVISVPSVVRTGTSDV